MKKRTPLRLIIYMEKEHTCSGKRRKSNRYILLSGATENNLKNIDVKIPLGIMTAVTGVSGSGKSTLIKTILVPALKKNIMETIPTVPEVSTV